MGDKRKMTVLEKIERCVSLVWDFQEIYGEEDIEDFCRKELRTYPQHDEIMEYFKHIAELEKENAELKEALKGKRCNCMTYFNFKDLEKECDKAKEIIKKFLLWENDWHDKTESKYELLKQAEQFIKDSEVMK